MENHLQIHGARASSVIVQQVPPHSVDAFTEWQRGISEEVAKFPGYLSTEVYPARDPRDQWVTIIHFADPGKLNRWLDSSERTAWLAKRPSSAKGLRLTVLPTGLGEWFAGLPSNRVPTWKAALTVLLGLYPTVMLLRQTLVPQLQQVPPAFAILLGNAVSVAFLQWVGMPLLGKAIRPWIRSGRIASLVGAAGIIAVLVVLAYLFQSME